MPAGRLVSVTVESACSLPHVRHERCSDSSPGTTVAAGPPLWLVGGVLLSALDLAAGARRRPQGQEAQGREEHQAADDELDHSSKELQAARPPWPQSQADSSAPGRTWPRPRPSSGRVVLDQQMQAKLDAAEARLAQARTDLAMGQAEGRGPERSAPADRGRATTSPATRA